MGNGFSSSIKKMNYENIQDIVNGKIDCIIINTLNQHEQECLISKTILANVEEGLINKLLYANKKKKILIYGKNNHDPRVYTKYNQLNELGFTNVFIYVGGMFEWCLLQDIYGEEYFKTTSKVKDILYYKPKSNLNNESLLLLT
tara:strand:- start:236 stop:667 length:432 start_codon:yes stop_codon:yes gene_type:complete